jgi:hypothetical protein
MQNQSDIEAMRDIRDVLYTYCRAMDRIDSELGYQVWHDDGTAHYSELFQGSGRGFIDWVCDLHRPMIATSHQITNIITSVDGDIAVSESYVTVRLRTHDNTGGLTDIVGVGRYLDRWSYRNNRWAIDHRQYVTDIRTSMPVPATDSRETLAPGATAAALSPQSNRSDPSYPLFEFKKPDLDN